MPFFMRNLIDCESGNDGRLFYITKVFVKNGGFDMG